MGGRKGGGGWQREDGREGRRKEDVRKGMEDGGRPRKEGWKDVRMEGWAGKALLQA